MAGIYIHIPFCSRRCHYCDFYSTANLAQKKELLHALTGEIGLQKDFLKGEEADTVYFGGGTPSLLAAGEIKAILYQLAQHNPVSCQAEITLEANPDDITGQYIRDIRDAGINRLSIGIQSFSDRELKMLNRRHDAKQAIESVHASVKNGIVNISIDLIYGLPGQTPEQWEENVKQALALPVDHISAYHLSIEKGTAFYHMMKKEKIREADESDSLLMFRRLIEMAGEAGYEQYEISNFARNKNFSRHNSAYWKKVKYLGLGPSAHSYDGVSRQWNVADVGRYIEKISNGKEWFEREKLSEKDRMNETIMTSLRTMWGLDTKDFESSFGSKAAGALNANLSKFIDDRSVELKGNTAVLTMKGKMISDYIIRELFF